MSFGHPLLLLSLLVVPVAIGLYLLAERRRMRYAVTLHEPRRARVGAPAAGSGGGTSRSVLFLLALAALCVAIARPHAHDARRLRTERR